MHICRRAKTRGVRGPLGQVVITRCEPGCVTEVTGAWGKMMSTNRARGIERRCRTLHVDKIMNGHVGLSGHSAIGLAGKEGGRVQGK